MILFPVDFLISFGIHSTLKLGKYVTSSACRYNDIQWIAIDLHSAFTRFIIYAPSFIF